MRQSARSTLVADFDPARTSAVALLLMALGLGLLYHAGPWFWASRTLTLVGSVLPLAVLARALWDAAPSTVAAVQSLIAFEVVLVLAVIVAAVNLVAAGDEPYRLYALSNIAAQLALALTWAAWLTIAWRSWVAWLGTAMALTGALGFAANSHLRIMEPTLGPPSYIPPDPWCSTRSGECGPVDMLSRLMPDLVPAEVGMMGVAFLVWLLVVALPWARGRA